MLCYLFSAKVNAFFLVVALASGRMTSSDSFVEYMVAMIFPTRAVNILKAWCFILGRNSEDLVTKQKLFCIIRRDDDDDENVAIYYTH